MDLLTPPPPPAPLTPQQQLAAQVAADKATMAAAVQSVIKAFVSVATNVYFNQLSNGTSGETFGPQDYANAMGADAAKMPELNALFQQFIGGLATITPPSQPLTLPALPPAGVTFVVNGDGTITFTGQTPLQVVQSATIDLTAKATARAAAFANRTADPQGWTNADAAWATAKTTLATAQVALKAAISGT